MSRKTDAKHWSGVFFKAIETPTGNFRQETKAFPGPADRKLRTVFMADRQDAEATIRKYFEGPCYYDWTTTGIALDEIGVLDICLTATVNSRVGYSEIDSIMGRKDQIDGALKAVEKHWTLEKDFSREEVRRALRALFEKMVGRHIGVSRATKVLHKKRPLLIPMLDNLLIGHLCSLHHLDEAARNKPLLLMEHFRDEMVAEKEFLEGIKISSKRFGSEPTILRKYEVLLWHRHTLGAEGCSCSARPEIE